jgi:3',5'-cyclic AMP phosphodiesterase CpdA
MNRRDFIKQSALLAGVASLPPLVARAADALPDAKRGFRLAHITDSHAYAEKHCPENLQNFLHAFTAVRPGPDLILHTGDVIMDGTSSADRGPVEAQWNLWRDTAKGFSAPVRYAIGNHDIWLGDFEHPRFPAKQLAMERMGMESPYYRFEAGGWVFLVLDSIRPKRLGAKLGFDSHLDAAQREWFVGELARIPDAQPLMICSHVPILSAGIHDLGSLRDSLADYPAKGKNEPGWVIWGPMLHGDTHEMRAMLRKRAGVTVCLSGHLHLKDDVVYDNVHYLGNGAICANWWKESAFHQTKAGFAMLDLFPDGRWERAYHTYEWVAG